MSIIFYLFFSPHINLYINFLFYFTQKSFILAATLELLTGLPEISSATDTQKTSAIGSTHEYPPYSLVQINVDFSINCGIISS